MTGPTFVSVPAAALEALIRDVAAGVVERGGKVEWGSRGRERVVEIRPHAGRGAIQLYTSLAVGAEEARDCGEDAIRIVVGAIGATPAGERFLSGASSRRVFRTAPRNLPEAERVAAFVERLREALREAYGEALRVPECAACQAGMLLRKGPWGQFWGCSRYPACRGRRPTP